MKAFDDWTAEERALAWGVSVGDDRVELMDKLPGLSMSTYYTHHYYHQAMVNWSAKGAQYRQSLTGVTRILCGPGKVPVRVLPYRDTEGLVMRTPPNVAKLSFSDQTLKRMLPTRTGQALVTPISLLNDMLVACGDVDEVTGGRGVRQCYPASLFLSVLDARGVTSKLDKTPYPKRQSPQLKTPVEEDMLVALREKGSLDLYHWAKQSGHGEAKVWPAARGLCHSGYARRGERSEDVYLRTPIPEHLKHPFDRFDDLEPEGDMYPDPDGYYQFLAEHCQREYNRLVQPGTTTHAVPAEESQPAEPQPAEEAPTGPRTLEQAVEELELVMSMSAGLEDKIEALEGQVSALEAANQQQRSVTAQLQRELSQRSGEKTRLERELSAALASQRELESQLAAVKEDLDMSRSRFTSSAPDREELEQYKQLAAKRTVEVEEAEKRAGKLRDRITHLEKKLETSRAENEERVRSLQGVLASLPRSPVELREVLRERDALSDELDTVKAELEEQRQVNNMHGEELREYKDRAAAAEGDLETLRSETPTKQFRDMEDRIRELRHFLVSVEVLVRPGTLPATEMPQRLSDVLGAVKGVIADRNVLQDRVVELREEYAATKAQLAQEYALAQERDNLLAEERRERESQTDTIAELRNKLHAMSNMRDETGINVSALRDKYEAELEEERARVASLTSDLDREARESLDAQNALSEARVTINALNTRVQQLESRLRQASSAPVRGSAPVDFGQLSQAISHLGDLGVSKEDQVEMYMAEVRKMTGQA